MIYRHQTKQQNGNKTMDHKRHNDRDLSPTACGVLSFFVGVAMCATIFLMFH